MTGNPVLQHDTPHGTMTLAATDRGLTRVTFRAVRRSAPLAAASPSARRWLDLARRELDAYFAGQLRRFTVPADLHRVDEAHCRILDALSDVGYGETTTYGALAARLGLVDDGARQVGAAMARNPVLIVVPCHRVLGAGGTLTGYAGGLATKQALLDIEGKDGRANSRSPSEGSGSPDLGGRWGTRRRLG
jgi:methylated-DNA-[protein]-cysteine S-methyltransferase